jgi:DNA polymerase-3 subunit alpha
MQKYLRELQPTKFEDLIALNALYRVGSVQYIPDFIARKHGRKPITYDFPEMEGRLKDTYGITVYQEQIMLLSQDLAGFTRGQSDELRKAIGKNLIGKYAFNKSHATCYAWIAYQMAYLKAHYPTEFNCKNRDERVIKY